jgi:co-chaperonin GroES (HSP10)
MKIQDVHLQSSKGKLSAIGDKILVSHMDFGEQKTAGGLIISSDNGKTRGIYPRWAKVYDVGPSNKDGIMIGDWILIEHGRWTRSILITDDNGQDLEVRMVENESILLVSDEKPNEELRIGAEYADGEHATVDPSAFVNSSGALAQ